MRFHVLHHALKKSGPPRSRSSRPASAPRAAASRARRCVSSRTLRCRRAWDHAAEMQRTRDRPAHGRRSACGTSRPAPPGRRARRRARSRCRDRRWRAAARARGCRLPASRRRRRPARRRARTRRCRESRWRRRRGPAGNPANASSVASAAPSSSLRSRVSTLPRNVMTSRSGRSRFTCACRRSEAVPTTAPRGNSRSALARRLMNTSRTSSRGRKAASTRLSGRKVGTSLAECTARSMLPASSASSISLVNSPLPPASANGRS